MRTGSILLYIKFALLHHAILLKKLYHILVKRKWIARLDCVKLKKKKWDADCTHNTQKYTVLLNKFTQLSCDKLISFSRLYKVVTTSFFFCCYWKWSMLSNFQYNWWLRNLYPNISYWNHLYKLLNISALLFITKT